MNANKDIDMISKIKEKSSVQAHINMMQGIINRMANNSSNCKLWCITIMSAVVALFFDKKLNNIEYCYYIATIFYFLDCYYLGLERQFVRKQNDFVNMINRGVDDSIIEEQIFLVSRVEDKQKLCWLLQIIYNLLQQLWQTIKAAFSFSTTPFYSAIMYAVFHITNLNLK